MMTPPVTVQPPGCSRCTIHVQIGFSTGSSSNNSDTSSADKYGTARASTAYPAPSCTKPNHATIAQSARDTVPSGSANGRQNRNASTLPDTAAAATAPLEPADPTASQRYPIIVSANVKALTAASALPR